MVKPQKPRPSTNRKTPKAERPAAPARQNVHPGGKDARAGANKALGNPGALVNRRAADRLRSGHLWVYASDIEAIALPESAMDVPPALLPVADHRGLLLGTALYSPSSQIALRLFSPPAGGAAEGVYPLAHKPP